MLASVLCCLLAAPIPRSLIPFVEPPADLSQIPLSHLEPNLAAAEQPAERSLIPFVEPPADLSQIPLSHLEPKGNPAAQQQRGLEVSE